MNGIHVIPHVRKTKQYYDQNVLRRLSDEIDILVGMNQLYHKVSNTPIRKHSTLSSILLNTICGYTLGGTVEDKNL